VSSGFKTIIVSKNKQNLVAAHERLGSHSYICSDLSKTENVKLLADQISLESRGGRLTVFVNAAGITLNSLLMKSDEAEILQCMNTNLMSSILLSKYLCKDLMKSKGSIVNIASIIGPLKQQQGMPF
jgi:short-subunit dehydrogenase